MTPVELSCPACQCALRVAAVKPDSRVRCPRCGEVFAPPAPAAEVVPAVAPIADPAPVASAPPVAAPAPAPATDDDAVFAKIAEADDPIAAAAEARKPKAAPGEPGNPLPLEDEAPPPKARPTATSRKAPATEKAAKPPKKRRNEDWDEDETRVAGAINPFWLLGGLGVLVFGLLALGTFFFLRQSERRADQAAEMARHEAEALRDMDREAILREREALRREAAQRERQAAQNLQNRPDPVKPEAAKPDPNDNPAPEFMPGFPDPVGPPVFIPGAPQPAMPQFPPGFPGFQPPPRPPGFPPIRPPVRPPVRPPFVPPAFPPVPPPVIQPFGPPVIPPAIPPDEPPAIPPADPVVPADPPVIVKPKGPFVRPAANPAKITPTKADDKTEIKLPGAVDLTCFGGGGRYVIMRIPSAKQIAVLDVCEGKVTKFLPLPEDGALIAASNEHLFVLAPTDNVLQRWNLSTFEKERTVANPLGGAPRHLLVGHATDGPLFVVGPNKALDTKTFKEVPLGEGATGGRGLCSVFVTNRTQVNVSADGRVFAWHTQGVSPTGLSTTVLGADEATSHHEHTTVGAILPGPDGTLFTAAGLFTPELKLVGEKVGYQYWRHAPIPAAHGKLYLTIAPEDDTTLAGRKAPPRVLLKMIGDNKPLLDLTTLAGLDIPANHNQTIATGLQLHNRVFLVPDAKAVAILHGTADKVTIHKLDVAPQP